MTNKELISIIIPCYNQEQYLPEALQSVADQTYPHWECIIVDDGSPDQSETIARQWCARDNRFSYIQKPNSGVSNTRNVGIEAAKGKYILPLDGDDKISPNYLEGCVNVLENNPDTRLVYGKASFFGAQQGEWHLPDFEYDQLLTRNLIYCTGMYRKADWQAIGGYDEQMVHGLEDWDFWLRLIQPNDRVVRVNAIHFYYRIKSSSRNTDLYNNQQFVDQTYAYLYQKHYEKMKRMIGSPIQLYMEKEELEKQVQQLKGGLFGRIKRKLKKMSGSRTQKEVHHTNAATLTVSGGSSKISLIKNKVKANIGNQSLKEIIRSAFFYLTKKGLHRKFNSIIRFFVRKLYVWVETDDVVILDGKENVLIYSKEPYAYWRSKHEVSNKDYDTLRKHAATFTPQPFFTVMLFIRQVDEHVKRSVQSVFEQVYTAGKLVVVVPTEAVRDRADVMLKEINSAAIPAQVVLTSAAAASVETGTNSHFMLNLKPGDLLTPDALYWFAFQSVLDPDAGMIYADEDQTDGNGHFYNPHFKPDWSPDNLLSFNYIQHAVVVRATILQHIPNWATQCEKGVMYDLVLQASEQTQQVSHISRILYRSSHRTESVQSNHLNKQALSEAMKRRADGGEIQDSGIVEGVFIPRYPLKTTAKVSIIIPTKDKIEILKTCIDSIVERSTYQNVEIILIDNNSSKPDFFEQVKKWEQALPGIFRCVRTEAPFNFAYLMNFGASFCTGDFYILLNNDTEVITPNWIELMMEQAQRPSIGVVGAKLLYPDNTIQHAGVIMGMSGLADHVFVGVPRYGLSYQHYIHRVINYSALTAACLMVSKQKFNEVNGFNEQFEVEYNDIDFCLRLKAAGYNHVYLPHVELYHHESISRGHPFATPASYERHIREHKLMQHTWQDYISHDPCYNRNLSLRSRDMRVAY